MESVRVSDFESEFAELVACRHAVVMTSPAAALRLALQLAGVEAGFSVLLPATFWTIGVPVVAGLGATVTLADLSPVTATISAQSARLAISSRPRAIVADDSVGMPVDADALRSVATEVGAALVEYVGDAAGALYKGGPAGARADLAVWSLKDGPLASGSGAVLTVNRADWAEYARILRRPPLPAAENLAEGLRRAYAMYRATLSRRTAIERLRIELAGVNGIRMVASEAVGSSSGWSVGFELIAGGPDERDELVSLLCGFGLDAFAGWGPAGARPVPANGEWLPIATRLQQHAFSVKVGDPRFNPSILSALLRDYVTDSRGAA